jgi:glucose-1-phosphate thymidylyltransferase
LRVEQLGRGFAWFATGTQESLLQAANFVETVELRQGLKIACPEEVAHYLGLIDDSQLRDLATHLARSTYGKYLLNLLDEQAQRTARAATAS